MIFLFKNNDRSEWFITQIFANGILNSGLFIRVIYDSFLIQLCVSAALAVLFCNFVIQGFILSPIDFESAVGRNRKFLRGRPPVVVEYSYAFGTGHGEGCKDRLDHQRRFADFVQSGFAQIKKRCQRKGVRVPALVNHDF